MNIVSAQPPVLIKTAIISAAVLLIAAGVRFFVWQNVPAPANTPARSNLQQTAEAVKQAAAVSASSSAQLQATANAVKHQAAAGRQSSAAALSLEQTQKAVEAATQTSR